jgi:hypothetical protein
MHLIRREDFFRAQMLLRLHGLGEMILARAGSLWVEGWLKADQLLCLINHNIGVSKS